MERLSIFDIFKIGVGPSSSHTLGPWLAARDFARQVRAEPLMQVEVLLFGSLAQTGIGHATDIAVQLGLAEYDPTTIDTDQIPAILSHIKQTGMLTVAGQALPFEPKRDIQFVLGVPLEHPNTLSFRARTADKHLIEQTYFSLGGGFYCKAEAARAVPESAYSLPYPIDSGQELLAHCRAAGKSIAQVVACNEGVFRDAGSINHKIKAIFDTMLHCVHAGCSKDGVLPGGLGVKRRAKAMHEKLYGGPPPDNTQEWLRRVRLQPRDFSNINKWVSCFALAVNEQNASLSRVVTSPTNGAAGVIPAVLLYYLCFCEGASDQHLQDFFFTAGEIGCLFKKGATISAAMGGCQAEIGVSSAMAAGGLTQVLGGTPEQVLAAAEIAMEHHLGLTCDPVGGLVQIPCIERNAMGAMKAITAAHLSLERDASEALIHFDAVVKTMWETAQDMHTKYKETSTGGLALQMPVVLSDC
ncbi:MAG: L-serine ammonia-lyase [Bacteroidetes bacterium]|nr:MAG: L-serine ammonia-lyase [Bacteroidota bacterium]